MLVILELEIQTGYSKYNILIFGCSLFRAEILHAGLDIQSRIFHPGYIFRAEYSKLA
jgi:hypothetical protein